MVAHQLKQPYSPNCGYHIPWNGTFSSSDYNISSYKASASIKYSEESFDWAMKGYNIIRRMTNLSTESHQSDLLFASVNFLLLNESAPYQWNPVKDVVDTDTNPHKDRTLRIWLHLSRRKGCISECILITFYAFSFSWFYGYKLRVALSICSFKCATAFTKKKVYYRILKLGYF